MKTKLIPLFAMPFMITAAIYGMHIVDDTLVIEGGDDEYMLFIRDEPRFASITHLQWTNSKLTSIRKDDFKLMKHLSIVDLRYNKIKTVDLDAFKHLKELKMVDLSGNPLSASVKEKLKRNLGDKLILNSPKPDHHEPVKISDESPVDNLDGDSE